MLQRHPRLALLALLLGVSAAAMGAAFVWAQYHLDAAQHALKRYAFDEAQHHLDLSLKVRSVSTSIHLLATQAARRRDAYEEAERHLADSIQLGGITPSAALERMLLSAQQGDLDDVEASLRGHLTADDADAELVLEALAKGYANRFWDSQALECLNVLLERQPKHPQARLLRAHIWENRVRRGESEHVEDALRDYEKAVELNPTFESQLGLACALDRAGRPWDAMLTYERLRVMQPANPEVMLGLARCRYNLHEVEESSRLLDELLHHNPNHAAALLERGRLAFHAGLLAEAEKHLRPAAAAAPRYESTAQRLLCQCLLESHQSAKAQRCRDELHRKEMAVLELERRILRANRDPQDVALRYEIASELMRLDREQEAVATLFFILEQQPGHRPARAALIDYLERKGLPRRAAHYRRDASPITKR